MKLEIAKEIAKKYSSDIEFFGTVDKNTVSQMCKTLLLQLQAYKEKEDKLREYVKDLKEDALKDLSEVEIKYAFDCIIFALNKILDGSDE